jgi:Kef-type K+ transport system membrane component KefB
MRFWLAHLALLPLCAWALVELFSVSSSNAAVGVATWLVVAVVVHDLVVLPLYSGADRLVRGNNYVRVPGALSLLMLVVFWGTIGGRGEGAYRGVSGRSYEGYATRWLFVTAGLFAVSGVLYLLRRRSGARRRRGP